MPGSGASEHRAATSAPVMSVGSSSRQRITLLFTDLSNSTGLARALEPEEYDEVLEKIRGVWHVVAERYGGLVVRTQGDGALILFGIPQLAEDDGRRAVEAALDIHEEVGGLEFNNLPGGVAPLRMHSGVHAGTLLVSPGDIERGRFDLKGDVANTAANFSHVAKGGQIIASVEALGPHANFFELDDGPIGAASDPRSPDTKIILRRSGVLRRYDATARRGLTSLVGRDPFVTRIQQFLSAEDGTAMQRRCMVLVGSAGMGKTRLLEQIVLRPASHAMVALRGGCESYLGAEALQPFSQMVRSFFGVPNRRRMADLGAGVIAALRPWQERLGPASQSLLSLVATDSEIDSKRMTTGGIVGDLMAFFTALAAEQPVLLVIDDWQWADDASRQLLGTLLDASIGPKIVLASRPSDFSKVVIQGAPHLYLTPLAESETRQAIRHWLPSADPFLCAQIYDYSGGTPLFIEELCHSASVGALARAIEDRGAARNWLAGLAATRLARLPQDLADLVRAAAVIGNEVHLWLLEIAFGRAPTPESLAALERSDFLYSTNAAGILRFKHGVTRDAVYQSIGLRERTALHERVLGALLSRADDGVRDDYIEALAYHSRGAGQWDEAAGFAERAGDRATGVFALDRARVHYELAMEALDRIVQRTPEQALRWCKLSNKLGMTCVFDPLTLANNPSVFERAVELAESLGDANVLSRAKYWLAYICYGLGRFRESLRHTRSALALAQQAGDQRLVVQIEATLGQVLAATCDYAQAIELIDVAVDAKRQRSRPRGGLAIGSAYALACKGGILADQGDFPAAHACFDEAIDLLAGSTHPVGNSVRNWIAVAYNWQGNWNEAKRIAADSLRIAENTRALLLLSAARSAGGYAAWAADGNAAGLEQLGEAMRWMDERQGHFYASIYFGWLAAACVAEGRTELARSHAAKVLQRARRGEHLGKAVACRSLAWTAATAGNEVLAARWMRRAEVTAARRRSPREAALNQWMRGQIRIAVGRGAEAEPLFAEAIAGFERMAMTWHAQRARRQLEEIAVGLPVFT